MATNMIPLLLTKQDAYDAGVSEQFIKDKWLYLVAKGAVVQDGSREKLHREKLNQILAELGQAKIEEYRLKGIELPKV